MAVQLERREIKVFINNYCKNFIDEELQNINFIYFIHARKNQGH